MFYANDETTNQEKLYIDEILPFITNDKKTDIRKTHIFTCPNCGNQVIVKNGRLVKSHFAHKSTKECDEWRSVMTEWHKGWQDYFYKEPGIEHEETIIQNNVKHVADIFIPSENCVIEFQHSSISFEKLIERIEFYASNHNNYWVFDWTEKDYILQDTSRDFEWFLPTNKVGKKLTELYKYVNTDSFRENYGRVILFFDIGDNSILQMTNIWKDRRVYFKEHRYSYFKHNFVINKQYNGFSDYLANEDIK